MLPGTYTINSDCTGTALEAGAHHSFVIFPDGKATTWMEPDPGVVFSGTEVRLKPVEDAAEQTPLKRQARRARFAPHCGAATRESSIKKRAYQPAAFRSFQIAVGNLFC